jgi:hypothetical protein
LFNHKHLKIHHRTNLIHIFQSQTGRRGEEEEDVRHQLRVRQEEKGSKENTDKMVSNVNHFCGFVNYRTLNLE